MSNYKAFILLAVALLAADAVAQSAGGGGGPMMMSPQEAEMKAFNDRIKIAHAVLGSAAWVFFFPVGSILLRILNGTTAVYVHSVIQFFAMLLLVANAGMGIKLALNTNQMGLYHPIIGVTLFALVWFQAAGGLIHHLMWRKKPRRTIVTYVHIWLGRAMITLGMIEGGLGLLLSSDAQRNEYIAYGVIAGLIWVIWIAVDIWAFTMKPKPASRADEKMSRTSS